MRSSSRINMCDVYSYCIYYLLYSYIRSMVPYHVYVQHFCMTAALCRSILDVRGHQVLNEVLSVCTLRVGYKVKVPPRGMSNHQSSIVQQQHRFLDFVCGVPNPKVNDSKRTVNVMVFIVLIAAVLISATWKYAYVRRVKGFANNIRCKQHLFFCWEICKSLYSTYVRIYVRVLPNR